MISLATLRPRDTTSREIAAALSRTETSARGIAAEIARVRATHAGLLVFGTAEAIAASNAELAQLQTDGQMVMDLHAELQRMAAVKPAPAPSVVQAHAAAVEKSQELMRWWAQHGDAMTSGLRIMGDAALAMIAWQAALNAAPTPSNVVPLQPSPGAA